MNPTSQITITDGTIIVNIDGFATLGLVEQYNPVEGGSTVTRFLDGSAIKQTSWIEEKWRIQIQATGWVPSGLWDLDYTVPHTWTVPDPAGPANYTVYSSPPDETWNINEAASTWTLTGEEI